MTTGLLYIIIKFSKVPSYKSSIISIPSGKPHLFAHSRAEDLMQSINKERLDSFFMSFLHRCEEILDFITDKMNT